MASITDSLRGSVSAELLASLENEVSTSPEPDGLDAYLQLAGGSLTGTLTVESVTGSDSNYGIFIKEPTGGATFNTALHVEGFAFFQDRIVSNHSIYAGNEVGENWQDFPSDNTILSHRDGGDLGGTVTSVVGVASYALGHATGTDKVTGTLTAGDFQAAVNGDNSVDWRNNGRVIGVKGGVDAFGASGDVSQMAAFWARDSTITNMTATNVYGMYIEAQAGATNNYGIYIEAPTGGTINDAIHVVGGRTFLGGTLHVGSGTSPAGAFITAAQQTVSVINDESKIQIGIYSEQQYAFTSASDQSNATIQAFPSITGANTADLTDKLAIVGVQSSLMADTGASGTVTGLAGFAYTGVWDMGGNSVSYTNQYGFYIENLGKATNNYGIYIEEPTGTIAHAIHVEGGRTFLGGTLHVGASTSLFDGVVDVPTVNVVDQVSAHTLAQGAVSGELHIVFGLDSSQTNAAVGGIPVMWDGNTSDLTADVGMAGFSAMPSIHPNSLGTVTGAAGFYAQNAYKPGPGADITNLYGMYVDTQSVGTNNYGIYVEEPTGGTINDAIHVVGGRTFLGGDLEMDGALNHTGTTMGVYNTTPIAQQTGVSVDAASIHAACVALGLFTA